MSHKITEYATTHSAKDNSTKYLRTNSLGRNLNVNYIN